jgi:uncharacterized protein (DUF362 family)
MAKSRVVRVKNLNIYGSNDKLNFEQVQKLINRAIIRLTDAPDAAAAWKTIAGPGDVFGIKPNCLAGKKLSSSPAVAMAMVDGLKSAGVKMADIIIWERSNRELERAGYKLNYAGNELRCYGNDSRGVGYGGDFHQQGRVASLLSKIYEDQISKNINFPLLKDHSLAGISAGMKNMYGLVHNPNKYHPDNCNPYVAEVSALPIVRKKNVLTVCDLTTIQYHGGPGYMANYAVRPGQIMVSFDPVALDYVGYRMIEDYRRANGKNSLKDAGREPVWLGTAAGLGLGRADLDDIEIIDEDIT